MLVLYEEFYNNFFVLLNATLMSKFVRIKRLQNGHRFDWCADINVELTPLSCSCELN